MLAVTRTPQVLRLSASSRLAVTTRTYATQTIIGTTSTPSSGSKRRAVTPFNDNGRVPWGQLSAGEKIGRTTQQSFNFGLMILGALATVRPYLISILGMMRIRILTLCREVLSMSCIQKSSRQIVKRIGTTEPLRESKKTQDVKSFSVTLRK